MLTVLIFAMGVVTVVLSCYAAEIFFSHRSVNLESRKLSGALGWQLLGEAVIGTGTVVFAYSAHIGALQNWSIELQSSIRFLMFFATSITTIHLVKTIRNL